MKRVSELKRSVRLGSLMTAGLLHDQLSVGGSNGAEVYGQKCGICHASDVMHPGYANLNRRTNPQPDLTTRHDLSIDVIKRVARNGLGTMLPSTPTQLSNDDIDQIARFLAHQ